MKKTVGVLGCGGAVGKEVIRHLSEKYSILGGQRSFCEFENKNVKWIKTDIFDPESLDRFCRQCDLVINSAGPSSKIKLRVAECAAANNIDYVDTSGESIYIERETDLFKDTRNSFVIGAGLEAGLSGLIPYRLVRDFDEVELAECYFGSRQRISRASLMDLLCSCFIDSGYANACYENGKIVSYKVPREEKHRVPGFRDEIYRKPYISNEISVMAGQCGIKAVKWYHAIADMETMNILDTLFESVDRIDQEDFLEALTDKYMVMFDAIANTRPLFNSILYDLTGIKNGEPIRKATLCQVEEAYRLCGVVSALAAEHLLENRCKEGVSWACEVLDAEKVIETLVKDNILRDFKTVTLPVDRNEDEEQDSGEL